MKRIELKKDKYKKNESPHFIGSWNLDNDNLCKEIIKLFEENKDRHNVGLIESGKDLSIKKTTDITIQPYELNNLKFKCLNDYIQKLHECFIDYHKQWPFLAEVIREVDIGSFNIQKYSPGGHFAKFHTERSGLSTSHRVFAWMTYLNDVKDGGSTNFTHYGMKIKPEIGKTLIWPAEWTHAHSGEILNSDVKYIVTGWMHFPHKNEKSSFKSY